MNIYIYCSMKKEYISYKVNLMISGESKEKPTVKNAIYTLTHTHTHTRAGMLF